MARQVAVRQHDGRLAGRDRRDDAKRRRAIAAPRTGAYHRARSTTPPMPKPDVFAIKFSKLHPLYVQKAEKKQRTEEEVDQVLCWLTGYDRAGLRKQIEQDVDLATFLARAPAIHPNASLIKGVVCGIRVEDIADPRMQQLRWMDKLIDELAKGKPMAKILRT
jgi:hypothetical protein